MENPSVSVVIPTFNRADTIVRAIESVLKQSYHNVDVIVVDDNADGSLGREATEEVMQQYVNNERVKYLKHHYSKNGSAARNTGARASDSKYIAFLDDDDEFLPKKIESQVKLLEQLDNTWGCCYSKFSTEKEGKFLIYEENREGDLYVDVLTRNIMLAAGSNLLVKKSVFDEVGGFDESFKRSQDVEFLVKVLRKYKIAYDSNYGLIVHVGNGHSIIDFDASCALYLKSFKKDLDELPDDVRNKFLSKLAKERFFFHFRARHDYKACWRMLINREVGFWGAFSYLAKMAYRHVVMSRKQK